MKYIFFFFFFLFISQVKAKYSCDEAYGPLYKEEILGSRMVQYDSSFCFAFAMANAVGIMLGQKINPFDIAYRYTKNFESGIFMNTLDFKDGGAELSYYNADFFKILSINGFCPLDEKSIDFEILKSEILIKKIDDLKRAGSVNPMEAMKKLYDEIIEMTVASCLEKKIESSRLRPVDLSLGAKAKRGTVLNSVNRLLKRGKPVIFNTANSLLSEGKGYHSILIVGSRKNLKTGHCEFQILDSMPKEYCDKYYTRVFDKDCERGTYWVPFKEVEKFGVSFIGFR